jgi:hypothetical protein
VNILEAIDNPALFRPWFRDPATWQAWRAFLAALFALPMTEEQRAIYTACTGRQAAPAEPFGEAWLVCGRRSGKSLTLAMTAVFLACFKDWSAHLAPGERGTILVLASDRRQARVQPEFCRTPRCPLLGELALQRRNHRQQGIRMVRGRAVDLGRHARIVPDAFVGASRNRATYTATSGFQIRVGVRQSSPSRSIASCAVVRVTAPSRTIVGQTNLPFSNLLARARAPGRPTTAPSPGRRACRERGIGTRRTDPP